MKKISILFVFVNLLLSFAVISASKKLFLVEEFTGDWCLECGEYGKPTMDTLIEKYAEDIIVIELHQSWPGKFDPMGLREADTLAGHFVLPDLPQASFDRLWLPHLSSSSIGVGVDKWDIAVNSLGIDDYTAIVDLKLNCIVDTFTRNLTAKIEADFIKDYIPRKDAELRFNVYVLEDDIIYPQAGNDSNYHHMNVCRAMIGGCWGAPGIIPDSVKAGQSYKHTFEYYIDPSWNLNNIHYVGFVNGYHRNDGMALKILNCVRGNIITDVENTSVELYPLNMKVIPNPPIENSVIEFTVGEQSLINLELYNLIGLKSKNIFSGLANKGMNRINFNTSCLPPGIYIIKLQSGTNISIMKIIKQ